MVSVLETANRAMLANCVAILSAHNIPHVVNEASQYGSLEASVRVPPECVEAVHTLLEQLEVPSPFIALGSEDALDLEWRETKVADFELSSGSGLHATLNCRGDLFPGPWSQHRASARTAEWTWEFKHRFGIFASSNGKVVRIERGRLGPRTIGFVGWRTATRRSTTPSGS